jgi:hypothetical protein
MLLMVKKLKELKASLKTWSKKNIGDLHYEAEKARIHLNPSTKRE